jgi:hypothetical protein
LSPPTNVLREGKSSWICLDARRVNRWTSPVSVRLVRVNELLQQFHGSKFITSTDLSLAFLQIPWESETTKCTALHHEGQIYQFTCTLYGFLNSLTTFVRALQVTLGPETCYYTLAYIDGNVCHSKSFDLYVEHLDTVLRKLTKTGFTVNISKCHFCRMDISFFGHVISEREWPLFPKEIKLF